MSIKENKEELKENSLKVRILSDKELENICGGFSDNGDGTYNLESGDTFYAANGKEAYIPCQDYENVTLDTLITIELFEHRAGTPLFKGSYYPRGIVLKSLGYMLNVTGYYK